MANRSVMCGKMVVDAVRCGVSQFQCGVDTVTDAVKCGTESVVSGVKGCGWDTVVQNVTDGATCGWRTVTDGATCGWTTFTQAFQCLGQSSFWSTGKCTFAKTCDVPNSCNKTFSVAKTCQIPKSCQTARLCDKQNTCPATTGCGSPTDAVDIIRHAEAIGLTTCRPATDIDTVSGCCGSPGTRGCIGDTALSLLVEASDAGACTAPADNALRIDPYLRFPICDLPAPTCGPGIQTALAATGDTFYVTSDLHFFRSAFKLEDQVAHVKVINDWATSVRGWKAFFGLPTSPGDLVAAPRAVIVNGDFTLGATSQELSTYRMLYEMGRHPQALRYPVFVGLGNHEETHNVANASSAKRLFDYVTDEMRCPGISMDVNLVAGTAQDALDGLKDRRTGSGNYSWDFGNVHHVQLNTWAGNQSSQYAHASDGLTWLANDLATKVGTSGRPVVLHQHFDFDENEWTGKMGSQTCSNRTQCLALMIGVIKNYNVVALFFGHAHSSQVTYTSYTDGAGETRRLDAFRTSTGGESGAGDFVVARTKGPY
ncbi:MAG: metallophosphoesterase, partial [Vicinamibacterales bacterium]